MKKLYSYTATMLALTASLSSISHASTFSDTSNHWANSYVQETISAGLMAGTGNNKFMPDKEMTYAEFAVVVVNGAFDGKTRVTSSDNHWGDSYLNVLVQEGLFQSATGNSVVSMTGTWQDTYITREDAATVIARLMDKGLFATGTGANGANLLDINTLSSGQQQDVRTVIANGIMAGTGSSFGVGNSLNRGQSSVIISTMLKNNIITSLINNTTPNTESTTTTTDSVSTKQAEYVAEVFRLVNIERANIGLPAYEWNDALMEAAQFKSDEMAELNYFAHESPIYGGFSGIIKLFLTNYGTEAENIARGQTTPATVVNSWMNSDGHKANILSSSRTQIGIGYNASGNYWTQQFTGSAGTPVNGSTDTTTPDTTVTPNITVTPDITVETTVIPDKTDADYVAEMFDLVNEARTKKGMSPLVWSNSLANSAELKVKEMVSLDYLEHTSPVYGSYTNIIRKYISEPGYMGEVIYKSTKIPEDLISTWLSNSSIDSVLFSTSYDQVGIAYYDGKWTAHFMETRSTALTAEESTLFRYINAEREKNGLHALEWNSELQNTASLKVREMVQGDYLEHTSPVYGHYTSMLKNKVSNFTTCAEVIYKTSNNVLTMFNTWLSNNTIEPLINGETYFEVGLSNFSNRWVVHFTDGNKTVTVPEVEEPSTPESTEFTASDIKIVGTPSIERTGTNTATFNFSTNVAISGFKMLTAPEGSLVVPSTGASSWYGQLGCFSGVGYSTALSSFSPNWNFSAHDATNPVYLVVQVNYKSFAVIPFAKEGMAAMTIPALASDTSTPSTDASTPSTDTSTPSTDTSTPSTDTSTPSTDTSTPSTDTSTPSTDTSTPSTATTIQGVFDLVNEERAKEGLTALIWHDELMEAAQFKSDEMAELNYFDHDSPVYGEFSGIIQKFLTGKYYTLGENIAWGQNSAAAVMTSWMNSTGHKANILSKNFTHIGIGYNAEGRYWTQQFLG